MKSHIFNPDKKFAAKLYLVLTLLFFVFVIGMGSFGYFIGREEGGAAGATMGLMISTGINLVWYLPGILLVIPYYNSLTYEVQEDEVIVRAGIVTKSVKHVPYRTVTNIKVMRDPFDRILGIGTLNIQTAGMSGQQGAEESLVGLTNVDAIYEDVAGSLRKFRSGMSPTQGSDDANASDNDVLYALLTEVREIKAAMKQ